MRTNERTAHPTAPVVLDCPTGCDWQIVSDSTTVAGLEQAAHRITTHATLPERLQVQRLVESYRQILGPLPGTLLILAVTQVLDTPAQADTALEVVA